MRYLNLFLLSPTFFWHMHVHQIIPLVSLALHFNQKRIQMQCDVYHYQKKKE